MLVVYGSRTPTPTYPHHYRAGGYSGVPLLPYQSVGGIASLALVGSIPGATGRGRTGGYSGPTFLSLRSSLTPLHNYLAWVLVWLPGGI